MAKKKHTLSRNDLALATFACAHAINWVKAQGRSSWWKKERAKFEALNTKLQKLSDVASVPWEEFDITVSDGSEPVMRMDFAEVRKLKRKASLAAKRARA